MFFLDILYNLHTTLHLIEREYLQLLRSTVQQIEWRRSKVLELRSEGLNQSEIAEKLKIHKSAINRDLKYLNEYARKNVETHLQEKLPEEYQLCMTRP